MIKLVNLWNSLRCSFWFVPMGMIVAALGLAALSISVDRHMQLAHVGVSGMGSTDTISNAASNSAQGASIVLSTIATSMLTVAGTTFSIAIVALQLASGQFGPRMLRDFMEDDINKVAFGICSSTFVYCLVVLWIAEDFQVIDATPRISVVIGLLLAIVSIFVLIYFVHNIAASIHADNLIAKIGTELEASIDRVFPERDNKSCEPRFVTELPANFEETSAIVRASRSGYVQQVDLKRLRAIATEHNLIIKTICRPGRFIVQGSEIAFFCEADPNRENNLPMPSKQLLSKLSKQMASAFAYGNQRNPEYDVEFPLKQLVEIALRAISPAVNDPFTAVRCIDRLSVALCYLLTKGQQNVYLFEASGQLRIIRSPVTVEKMIDQAFDQIRQYGKTDTGVTLRLLDAIEVIGKRTRTERERTTLRNQAEMISKGAEVGLPEVRDRQTVNAQYQQTVKALTAPLLS